MKTSAFLAGARPNYVKVFPAMKDLATRRLPIRQVLIQSGQHYDDAMSDVFLRDFKMEKPTYFLGVGSGPHALQTAKVMIFSPLNPARRWSSRIRAACMRKHRISARPALQRGRCKEPCPIEGWDGKVASRITDALREMVGI